MTKERVQKSSSWSPASNQRNSQSLFASRPFSIQAKPHSQQEIETQEFEQNKYEAAGLDIQAKHGTITPQGQERLTVLQAKMDAFWQQERKSTQRQGTNLLEIPNLFAPRETKAPPLIQTKLTIGEPGDKYEQEADRVAAQVVSQINAPVSQQSASAEPVQRDEMPQFDEEEELQKKPMAQPQSGGAKAGVGKLTVSRHSDRQIQMLPLTKEWKKPQQKEHLFNALKEYMAILQGEIKEVLEDTNGAEEYPDEPPLMLWDFDWKSSIYRQWLVFQKAFWGTRDIEEKATLIEQFASKLMNPPLNYKGSNQKSTANSQPRGTIEKIEPPEYLQGIEPGLVDNDYKKRHETIGKLRKEDQKYTPDQGAIYAPFIKDSREAISRLVQVMGDSLAIFSLERGGALVADHIVKMGGLAEIPNYKIAKDPQRHYDEKGEYKRLLHHKDLETAMVQFVKDKLQKLQNDTKITVAVTETVVSGTSTNTLLQTLNRVCKACPNIKIKLLLERQTIKQKGLKGKGLVRIDDPEIKYEEHVDANNVDKIEMFVSHVKYILGEDVGYQMKYEGQQDADKPLIVFNGDEENLVACKITPQQGTSARDAIIDLVSGAYDQALAEVLKG